MADRRPIIAANWKMHKTHLEAIQAVQKLSYLLDRDDADRVEVVICPPFTAIGTGRNAEPADAGHVVQVIRQTLAGRYDDGLARTVRVQYGGSVKPGNIREFMAHPEIDGALVGGASLDPEEFALIVKYR